MKKVVSIILIISLIMPYFSWIPNCLADDNAYTVEVIKNDGTIENIGTYNDYSVAKGAMDSYKSSVDQTAVIRRNGTIVNTSYGIFRLTGSSNTINYIYTDYGRGYINPAYNSDTLVLDYDPSSNRVKVMISGAIGWMDLSAGVVYPISFIADSKYDASKKYIKALYGNIRLREGAGVEYNQIGCNGQNSCDGGISTVNGGIYELVDVNTVKDSAYEWFKVNINGSVGYIANPLSGEKWIELYNPLTKQDLKTYYYVNSNNELVHQYYATVLSSKVGAVTIDRAPSYLKQNVAYYSFDGNYFYTDFTKMVDDIRGNHHNNAINKLPYYNYYQYLPARTQSNYNADNLNTYIGYNSKVNRDEFYELKNVNDKYEWVAKDSWKNSPETEFPKGQSMLYQEGSSFVESQNKYGVNATQTLALAINESAFGRSYMAVRNYNIFGHGAYDSAPDAYSAGYASIKDGIMAHAYKYISLDYSNPISGSHYYGSHYGNKLSGNNVSYASDAYWGEKVANYYYKIDKYFSFQDYYQRKTLGIKQIDSAVSVYSDPYTNSTKYYELKNIPNIPVTILEEVQGESINGNNVWYKIQSDIPINENRQIPKDGNGNIIFDSYNYNTSYAYVHSSYIYKETSAPVIYANDITVDINTSLDPLNGVKAYDSLDGDLTSKIKVIINNVNIKEAGNYTITYQVTDSENNTTEKQINVTVKGINYEVREALFYLDYLKNVDGKLQIKGYNTISGINNTIDKNIEYNIIFTDVNTNKTYTQKAIRITDSNEFTRPVFGLDDKDYTYSWFKLDINLNELPAGNYNMQIESICDGYKSVSVISNKLYKQQDVNFSGEKSVITKNNYDDKTSPVELIIRNKELAPKTASYIYNQYDTYRAFELNQNGLHLKGVSYSYGMDLNTSMEVKREIIFENVNDYNKIYRYDLGSTTDGLYKVTLPVDDGLDKTRAWYDQTFDISNIDIGRYVIYITTSSNITDISEFTEKLNRDISQVNYTFNGRKYYFEINQNKGNRIELIVE